MSGGAGSRAGPSRGSWRRSASRDPPRPTSSERPGTGTLRAPAPIRRPARVEVGGELGMISWRAPVIINPLLALGVKHRAAARIFSEPLAAYDQAGGLVP